MRRLLLVLFAVACGETEQGPFTSLPLDTRLDVVGLDSKVHVARDRFGIAHVVATTVRDLGFAQGYVTAHDRLPQLDMLRRFADGTLAEIYGAFDDDVVATDLEMRFHRMRYYASLAWDDLGRSASAGSRRDAEVVDLLTRFADGVNAYVDDSVAGRWPTEPAFSTPTDSQLELLFAPQQFTPWSPVDSLMIARFFTFTQSWSVPFELDVTELDVRAHQLLPARANDLLALAPIGTASPLAGLPGEVTRITGPPVAGTRPPLAANLDLFDRARTFFQRRADTGPHNNDTPATRALGPHAFMRPFVGSNAVAVGATYTGAPGEAMLAADMQLAPANPAVFYPIHAIVQPDAQAPATVDIAGVTLPGLPVILAGTSPYLAWAPTLGSRDVNDVYFERIAPCPSGVGACSLHGPELEPLETDPQEIRIGRFGEIESSVTVTYERVARHGPIIPEILNNRIVPRVGTTALAVAYTGYAPSGELADLWELATTRSVPDAMAIVENMRHGSDWIVIERDGQLGWGTPAASPGRDPAVFAWSVAAADGAAPFFVLDGQRAAHDWGAEQARPLSAIAPPQDFLVIADADPAHATDDGDPLNQQDIATNPLYGGIAYSAGLRAARLTELVTTAPRPITDVDMARFQHDTRSTMGDRLRATLQTRLAQGATGAPPDVAPFLAALTTAQLQQLVTAQTTLAAWSLETPTTADPSSAGTLLFNTWVHFFAEAALTDELERVGYPLARLDDNRVARLVFDLLVEPARLSEDPTSLQPALCDDLTTGPVESCTRLVLAAMLDAVATLEVERGAPDAWRWGAAHRIRFRPPFLDPEHLFFLPEVGDGFPLAGDTFVVDRTDAGWGDLDFTPTTGVAYRMLAIGTTLEQPLRLRLELQGGTILDRRDPHYRDLLETSYLARAGFDVPLSFADINQNGESRWEFR